jgi:hypothetical protein
MPVKPLSGVTPSTQGQRMALIADLMNKTSKTAVGATRPELLLSLLNDTENLSQFIRYSGISAEMGAALLRDISRATTHGTRFSEQSLGEINEVLAKIRPIIAGIDASYGAHWGLDDVGHAKTLRQSEAHQADDANNSVPDTRHGGERFKPFLPNQTDFANTIDNISLQSVDSETPKTSLRFADLPPLKVYRDGAEFKNGLLFSVLIGVACIVLIGIFVF